MKLVLASKNEKKLAEMNAILSELGVEVCSEAQAGVDVDVEETGTTFEENSLLKARAVMEASGLPAIADDSGLCVDALNGAPGVYSARYGGPELDDAGRYRLLLENLRGQTPRTAKFVSVITCCFPNGDVITARGECPGTIAFAPMGEGGFGYDPVFFIPGLKKTFAQLSAQEKNAISHRGRGITGQGLVGRDGRRDEQQLVQSQGGHRRLYRRHVPQVGRVEGAAVNSDLHVYAAFPGRVLPLPCSVNGPRAFSSCPAPERSCPFCPYCGLDDTARILFR